MGKYYIRFTDVNKDPIEIDEHGIDDTTLDVALFGRVRTEYGERLNQNLLNMMENFAVGGDPNVLPPTPTPMPSQSSTPAPSASLTPTPTPTPSKSYVTPSPTPTPSKSYVTPSPTPTPSLSSTPLPTPTPSAEAFTVTLDKTTMDATYECGYLPGLGYVRADVSGGVGPFTFAWSGVSGYHGLFNITYFGQPNTRSRVFSVVGQAVAPEFTTNATFRLTVTDTSNGNTTTADLAVSLYCVEPLPPPTPTPSPSPINTDWVFDGVSGCSSISVPEFPCDGPFNPPSTPCTPSNVGSRVSVGQSDCPSESGIPGDEYRRCNVYYKCSII